MSDQGAVVPQVYNGSESPSLCRNVMDIWDIPLKTNVIRCQNVYINTVQHEEAIIAVFAVSCHQDSHQDSQQLHEMFFKYERQSSDLIADNNVSYSTFNNSCNPN